jgi:cellulose synthase/poly-beta-1,6-N-acetylglucosamine synthase-like glycosyltransferase
LCVYNEENNIIAKLNNLLEIDYPGDLIDYYIGSDGSTDNTNKLLMNYTQNNFHIYYYKRSGKASIINKLVRESEIKNYDLLFFTDCKGILHKASVSKIASLFYDPKIGCASGCLVPVKQKDNINLNDKYWEYENDIKKMEGKLGLLIGTWGSIYAIRRDLFEPLKENIIADDFIISMRVLLKKYYSVFDDTAISFQMVAPDMKSEVKRKIRIASGNFQNLFILKRILFQNDLLLAFLFLNHKVIRWMTPILMFLLLSINLLLINLTIFKVTFCFQILFYIMSVLGYFIPKSILFKVHYFTKINIAVMIGLIKYLKGIKVASWENYT